MVAGGEGDFRGKEKREERGTDGRRQSCRSPRMREDRSSMCEAFRFCVVVLNSLA